MLKITLIFLGSGLGGVLRYALQGWVQRGAGGSFPAGTLAVNVLGCAAIGFLAAALAGPIAMREEYRVGLIVGILGGFTTFSAFGMETFHLSSAGHGRLAALYVGLSCALGIAAVWAGYRAAERWLGA
jgi:CrcB protein